MMSWEIDEPETVDCPYCHRLHDAEVFAYQGCPLIDLDDVDELVVVDVEEDRR